MTRKHMKKGGSFTPPNCYYNQNKKKRVELCFPRFLLGPKEMQRKGRTLFPSVVVTKRNRKIMVIVMMRTHKKK
jgi:hypothetical protein